MIIHGIMFAAPAFRFWNINLKMELCHMVKNESKVTTQVCDKITIDVMKLKLP